jgi:hypothetical protein
MLLSRGQKESVQGVEKEFSWPTIKIGILVVSVGIQSLKREHNKKIKYSNRAFYKQFYKRLDIFFLMASSISVLARDKNGKFV